MRYRLWLTGWGEINWHTMSLSKCSPSSQVGRDLHGSELAQQLEQAGVDKSLLVVDETVSTSLAVLPVFTSGGRGCWVDLSANDKLTPTIALDALRSEQALAWREMARALHVGYPHLLRGLQGEALAYFIQVKTSPSAQ